MTNIPETAVPRPSARRGWWAVIAITTATFSVVTSEMLPVGLLPAVADDLDVAHGTAGLTMTVPGLVAAVAAPLLTVLTGRFDRRPVLAGLTGLLALANLLSAWAPGIATLLASRVLVGVAIGGVWAIAVGLGARLVPGPSAGAATSLIFGGIAVASVLGVPGGTLVGEFAGWRAAFALMGVLSLAVTAAVALLLPPLPAERTVRFADVPELLRSGAVRAGLLVVGLLVAGHFAAYTYVRPVLEEFSGVGAGLVGPLLLVYGVSGVAGNFLGGSASARDTSTALLAISGVLGVAMLAMSVVRGGPAGAAVLLTVWGLAYGAVSVSTRNHLQSAAPQAGEALSSLFVAVFNLAIALGAMLGGRTTDVLSADGALWLGGVLALAALPILLMRRKGAPTTLSTNI